MFIAVQIILFKQSPSGAKSHFTLDGDKKSCVRTNYKYSAPNRALRDDLNLTSSQIKFVHKFQSALSDEKLRH